jgi:hypothetical protein
MVSLHEILRGVVNVLKRQVASCRIVYCEQYIVRVANAFERLLITACWLNHNGNQHRRRPSAYTASEALRINIDSLEFWIRS